MSESQPNQVIIAGAGLAGLCAALSAHEAGAKVVIIESAPPEFRGGNSMFSNGSFRVVHDGLNLDGVLDLAPIVGKHQRGDAANVRVASYTESDFVSDMRSTSRGRTNEVELNQVVTQSFDSVQWLADRGVGFELNLKFADAGSLGPGRGVDLDPGASLAAAESGLGLMNSLFAAVEEAGIEIRYSTTLDDLVFSEGAVRGVRVVNDDEPESIYGTVVLATGGFEANPEMRRKYLGHGWDLVPVRGTKFNTGRGLVRALELGALPGGHWGGCHSVPTDAEIPLLGDLERSRRTERYSYADGVLINEEGHRFIDEGEDLFTMTYTKVGAAICAQPGGVAYQIFDNQAATSLQTHYYTHGTPIAADSIEELAGELGLPVLEFVRTITAFNESCTEDTAGTGRSTPAGQPTKSQWARPIVEAPFVAYKVTSAISFTYGGIVTDEQMRVCHIGGRPIKGLYAAGGIVGGLFYYNYPAAAALTRSAVTGRIAGCRAAEAQSA